MNKDTQDDLINRSMQVFPGGSLGRHPQLEHFPHVPVRGQGANLWDAEGNRFVDYSLGGGALILGYSHPAVLEAVSAQMKQATQFISIINVPALEMGEMMLRALPWMKRVRFSLSGAEADFFAMRLARAFTKRDKVLKFDGAYHGNNDYSLWNQRPDEAPDYPHGEPDTAGIPKSLRDEILVAPYNDLEVTKKVVEQYWKDIAAIIVEPIQRYYGPKPGFLEGLRKMADSYGIILIFDEIVTGFRIAFGGAPEAFGVIPDLGVYGKHLGGGFPLSAVGGRADIMELGSPRTKTDNPSDFVYVTSSQAGNPIGCTAGLAVLRQLQQPELFSTFLQRAEYLKTELMKIVDNLDIDAQVVGVGPLWDVVFTRQTIYDNRTAQKSDSKKHLQFHYKLIEQGIMVRAGGRSYFSTAHTEPEIEETLRACHNALRQF